MGKLILIKTKVMELYNKIMLYFWLIAANAVLFFVSIMCIVENPRKWAVYFIFSAIAFMMYFFKKWMMKRMKKHVEFLEQNNQK